MQLTKEQIQNLYRFVEKHNVQWYDLQSELVDHLASDIEKNWLNEPALSFEQARYKATIKFGIKGFAKFVNEREKALTKKYNKMNLKYFFEYFKLPKLLLTTALIASVFLIRIKTDNYILTTKIISGFIYFSFLGYLLFDAYKSRKRKNLSGKKWLFEQNNSHLSIISAVFLSVSIYPYLFSRIGIEHSNFQERFITSSLFVLITIAAYITFVYVPKKIRTEASKNFMEYNI